MFFSRDALRSRLDALEYPFLETCDLSDSLDQQKLICWLEDVHIRRRPIEKRSPLRHKSFLKPLEAYLRELEAPFKPPTETDDLFPAVCWLTHLGLSLHYSDDTYLYNEPLDPWKGRCVPVVPGATKSPEVRDAVNRLLSTLLIETRPECVTDSARIVARIVEARVARLLRGADDDRMEVDGGIDLTEELPVQKLDLDELSLGFSTADPVVDRVGRILRVFYVQKLRQLQDSINLTIAEMQAVTADPKTDSKLGKVGR